MWRWRCITPLYLNTSMKLTLTVLFESVCYIAICRLDKSVTEWHYITFIVPEAKPTQHFVFRLPASGTTVPLHTAQMKINVDRINDKNVIRSFNTLSVCVWERERERERERGSKSERVCVCVSESKELWELTSLFLRNGYSREQWDHLFLGRGRAGVL